MKFKLQYGLKEGKLVHISDVEKGLKSGCVCPGCNHPLIARKGKKIMHHFAHYNGAECAEGLETALHLAAKSLLEKHRKIFLPKVDLDLNYFKENWTISAENYIKFDEVRLEYRIDSIIPDVIVYVKGRPLLIEITVTHNTEASKLDKIKKLGFSCLEIDLSKINHEITLQELESIVIDGTKYKKWLYNEKVEYYKQKAISLANKRSTITKGWLASSEIIFCPMKQTDISALNSCTYCEYCMNIGPSFFNQKGYYSRNVYCSFNKKIKNLKELIKNL